MAMMTQAAVERRFLDPAAIQLKYQLARMHHSCPLRFSAVAGGGMASFTLSVVPPPRSRFPRGPMKKLFRWLGERVAWEFLREPVREIILEILERLFRLFRGRCAAKV